MNNQSTNAATPRGILEKAGQRPLRKTGVTVGSAKFNSHHNFKKPAPQQGNWIDDCWVAKDVQVLSAELIAKRQEASDHWGFRLTVRVPIHD